MNDFIKTTPEDMAESKSEPKAMNQTRKMKTSSKIIGFGLILEVFLKSFIGPKIPREKTNKKERQKQERGRKEGRNGGKDQWKKEREREREIEIEKSKKIITHPISSALLRPPADGVLTFVVCCV